MRYAGTIRSRDPALGGLRDVPLCKHCGQAHTVHGVPVYTATVDDRCGIPISYEPGQVAAFGEWLIELPENAAHIPVEEYMRRVRLELAAAPEAPGA